MTPGEAIAGNEALRETDDRCSGRRGAREGIGGEADGVLETLRKTNVGKCDSDRMHERTISRAAT